MPRFLYAGAPRSGSTWLYHALRAHPEVFVPEAKGLEYFDRHYDRGLDWYLSQFAGAGNGQVAGELSHDVYAHPEAAGRIARDLPRLRVILCLREPGDFARSVIEWWLTHTRKFGRSPEDMAEHPHFSALLDFAGALERVLAALPREQLLVIFFEEIRTDPAEMLARLYGFVGVDPAFRPATIHDRINATKSPRLPALTQAIYAVGGWTRQLGGDAFVEKVKRWQILDSMLYGRVHRTAVRVPLEIVEEVRLRAAADFPRIESMLGRSLPMEWRKH